jgi:tetratricopeptide (TPR) repeat protein
MKKLIVLILSFLALSGNSQPGKIDSLRRVLRSEMADTSRVLVLCDLARELDLSKPDTSMILAEEGLALAKKTGFVRGEAECLNNIGLVFWITGNYPGALKYELEALMKSESLNDHAGMARDYGDIGIIYSEMGDLKTGIVFFRKCKIYGESAGNRERVVQGLINLGDNYENLNQLDSARIYTNQAYELALRINYTYAIGIALNNLGNICSKMKQDEIAMGYYHQSHAIMHKTSDLEGVCETTLGMAKLFRKAGQADSLLHYARLSLAAADQAGFTRRRLDASSFLAGYFKGQNLNDSAYRYQEITIAAKDSLFSREKVREVQNLSFLERIRQQEIAEANRKAEEERKANIQMLGIGTFITFFFVVLFVFSKKEMNRKAVKFLGVVGLLLLFEFISLFLHPYIAEWTHHIPVLMLVILVGIASVLVPLHHRLEELVKARLAKKMAYETAGTEEGR